MNYTRIRVEVAEQVGTVTLNRPGQLNAYTPEMGGELVHALRGLLADEHVRAVVLTGAGRGFCAGADRARLLETPRDDQPALGEEYFVTGFARELVQSPKPLIAAINGPAVGIGVTMLLSFDLRIASTEASFGFPFAKFGLVPGLGATHLLTRLVGYPKAVELVLTAASIGAQDALRLGLVNAVVDPQELAQAGRQLALSLCRLDPRVAAAALEAMRFGAQGTLESAMANEIAANRALAPVRRVLQ